MTSPIIYVKTEVLPENTEELPSAPSCDSDVSDDAGMVKRETVFIPVGGRLEIEESLQEDEEELSDDTQQGNVCDPLGTGNAASEDSVREKLLQDKEYVSVEDNQYENASSPSSWSFRLLEVTHETDCADQTTPALRQEVIFPEQFGAPQTPGEDLHEKDPFAVERARIPFGNGDPYENGAVSGKKQAERFTCAHCERTFFSKYCITKHVFLHTPSVNVPEFICELCGDVFLDANRLSRHIAEHGYEEQTGVQEIVSGQVELPSISQIRPFVCRTCGATFGRMGHLKVHEKIHANDRPHICDVCGKHFRQSIHLTIHKRLHSDERPYRCEICGKTFRQSVHLQIHSRLHTGYRPFSCDVCGRTFVDRTGLNRHKIAHTRDHPFGCKICGKSFTDEDGLSIHRQGKCATGPYTCDKCGRSFPDPFALKRHVRVHEGKKRKPCDVCGDGGDSGGRACEHTKPYVCKICSRDFVRASSLKRHVAIHSSSKKYECKECCRRFKYESSLSFHKCGPDPTPKPFACDICGKRFRFEHSAKLHRKVHTGESTHSCEVCGKLCTSAANLRSHSMVHSEERPHACETCGKGFRRVGNLVAHRKTHSGDSSDCSTCRTSFYTATEHVETHAEVPQDETGGALADTSAPPDCGATYASTLSYECAVCESSFTDAITYWRHMGEHTGNVRTGVANTGLDRDGAVYTVPSNTDEIYVLGQNPESVNGGFTCESEMVIPVTPEIVNMY